MAVNRNFTDMEAASIYGVSFFQSFKFSLFLFFDKFKDRSI